MTSDTDASGVTVNFTYDTAGRIYTSYKNVGPKTTYAYDAADHLLSTTLSDTSGDTSIVNARAYFDSGLVESETPAGQSARNYAYAYGTNAAGITGATFARTIANPDGGTRIDAQQLDGRPLSIRGGAVVEHDYAYSLDGTNSGYIDTTDTIGGTTSSRNVATMADWLGRPVTSTRPGFTGQPNFVRTNIYDSIDTNGTVISFPSRLIEVSQTASAPTKLLYDALGDAILTGVDLKNDNLALASTSDQVAGSPQYIESYTTNGNGGYWLHQESDAYPTSGSSTPLAIKTVRTRLTGFPANTLAETLTTDAYGNTADRVVTVSTSTQTLRATTTVTGSTIAQLETIVNGLRTSVKGADGLTTSFGYDGLERQNSVTDTRGNATTTAFYVGTTMPHTVTDASTAVIAAYTYDTQGRQISVTDATGNVSYFQYNQLGEVTAQWGTGAYPVAYGYDQYGMRTTMKAYRSGTDFNTSTWPSPSGGDLTTWNYDGPSGLLAYKSDASSAEVTYTYNAAGKVHTRTWARSGSITTTYSYDLQSGTLGDSSGTGALIGVSYSDGTPTVSFGPSSAPYFTRTGQITSVTDVTGQSAFNYSTGSVPTELDSITLPSFYSNSSSQARVLTQLYNADGYLPGRPAGFELGTSSSPYADAYQGYKFNSTEFFSSLTAEFVNAANIATFNYGYQANSHLRNSITVTGNSNYAINCGYETYRDLMTSIQGVWGSTVTQFNYQYNPKRQRFSALQSGSAFTDESSGTSYSSTYNWYNYDGFGQLQNAVMYPGNTPPTYGNSPTASSLPGRCFQYQYDNMGNRSSGGETVSLTDDTYDTYNNSSALDQYSSKTNDTVRILGTSNVGALITSLGVAFSSVDRNYCGTFVPPNSTGPAHGTITVTATMPTSNGGATENQNYFVPAATQSIAYDADGNLTSDGVWTYSYDAENRLISMATLLGSGFTNSNTTIYFSYDYLNRRVEKKTVVSSTTTLDHKYIYDGNNLVAEIDALSTDPQYRQVLRSYAWGLDVASSLTATGGVGALLQITNYTYSGATLTGTTNYLPTYDGNGNIACLINSSTGAVAVTYEYGPFGELLRDQVSDTNMLDNPFRFSTKYTDVQTGLVYYGLRYYNPTWGRFINRDPIEEQGGVNLYGFCGNDSVNGYDVGGMGPQAFDQFSGLQYLPTWQQNAIRLFVQSLSQQPYGGGGSTAGGLDPDMNGDLEMQTENNPPVSNSPGFLDGGVNWSNPWGQNTGNGGGGGQTRTYTYNGVQYAVTNDPNSVPSNVGTVYDVNPSTGAISVIAAPIGYIGYRTMNLENTNGDMVPVDSIGPRDMAALGDEYLSTVDDGTPQRTLGDLSFLSFSDIAVMAANRYQNPYAPQNYLAAVGSYMRQSGMGNTLQAGAVVGEAGAYIGPALVIVPEVGTAVLSLATSGSWQARLAFTIARTLSGDVAGVTAPEAEAG